MAIVRPHECSDGGLGRDRGTHRPPHRLAGLPPTHPTSHPPTHLTTPPTHPPTSPALRFFWPLGGLGLAASRSARLAACAAAASRIAAALGLRAAGGGGHEGQRGGLGARLAAVEGTCAGQRQAAPQQKGAAPLAAPSLSARWHARGPGRGGVLPPQKANKGRACWDDLQPAGRHAAGLAGHLQGEVRGQGTR